jgi:hypothetical protein
MALTREDAQHDDREVRASGERQSGAGARSRDLRVYARDAPMDPAAALKGRCSDRMPPHERPIQSRNLEMRRLRPRYFRAADRLVVDPLSVAAKPRGGRSRSGRSPPLRRGRYSSSAGRPSGDPSRLDGGR